MPNRLSAVPIRCEEAFLADAHADGLASSGGDAQLMVDGLVACRTGLAATTAGQRPDDDAVAGQVLQAEYHLPPGGPLFDFKGATDLVGRAKARLCPS
jgi:hypothetical protein